MHDKATLATTLAIALAGLAGIDNPLEKAKRATADSFPRSTRASLRNAHCTRRFDADKRKTKNKQAKKSKARNRKR